MQFSVENLTGLERRLTIIIPKENLDHEIKQRLNNLVKTTALPGFRAGKAPLNLIKKLYSQQVSQEVLQEVTQNNLEDALKQSNLNFVNYPTVEEIANEKSNDEEIIRCTFKLEVMPEFNLVPFENLVIAQPELVVEDADVDKMIEFFRNQAQTWNPVLDRPAEIGDRLKIDFFGKLEDGSNFPGNQETDVLIVLGSTSFIGEFQQQLVGTRAGENITIKVTFPSDYHQKELANQTVIFDITIKSVEYPILPEIDEEFIRNFGIVDGNLEEFRRQIRSIIERDLKHKSWRITKNQVLQELYQRHPLLELPKSLIAEEIKALRAVMKGDTSDESKLIEDAQQRVALGMIIGEIARLHKIFPSHRRVREYIRNFSEDYENPTEMAEFWLSDQKRFKEVEAIVVEDMVVEFVLENAQLQKKQTLLSDLMNINT